MVCFNYYQLLSNRSLNYFMDNFEKSLGELFAKLPVLPANVKEFLVKIAPWLTIISIVFALPGIFLLLGVGAAVLPFVAMMGPISATESMLSIVFTIATVVLSVLSLPGLFARTHSGWRFVFLSVMLGVLQSLINFSLGGLIIGIGLGLYILFQVREYYSG